MSIVFMDLEVENHEYFKNKIGPCKNPDNFVVASGWAVDSGTPTGVYNKTKEEALISDWVGYLKDPDVNLIVAHNLPFDLGWILDRKREDVLQYLRRGGRVFCTAYAEYLLSGNTHMYPSLDVVAPQYGGTVKIDAVKLEWELGKLTSEIDKELLYNKYLLGDGGDIENLRKVFYGQYQRMQDEGVWPQYLERMEGMLFACLCMDNGLHVDLDTARVLQAELQDEAAALSKQLLESINAPEEVQFNTKSRVHMGCWLYGGVIKYPARVPALDSEGNPQYVKVDMYMLSGTKDDPQYTLDTTEDVVKYTAGKNKGMPKPFKVASDVIKTKWGTKLYSTPGLYPIRKAPKDALETFDTLYQTSYRDAEDNPVYSVSSDALKHLRTLPILDEAKTVINTILRLAKVDKDLTTYYESTEYDKDGNEKNKVGMLTYVTDHNIVYHGINVTSTKTSRWSSNKPNLQNIPRGKGDGESKIKQVFNSRFDDPVWLEYALTRSLITQGTYDWCVSEHSSGRKAGRMVEVDFNALEARTQANFTKDRALLDAINRGLDMHCLRVSNFDGVPYETVLEAVSDKDHPEHKHWASRRQWIKSPSYAHAYGASDYGISLNCGISIEDARRFIESESKLFPDISKWYNEVVYPAVIGSTKNTRVQGSDGVWRVGGTGVWVSPGGFKYTFTQHPKKRWTDGKEYISYEYKDPEIKNYPCQGESAVFVQVMCGRVGRFMIGNNFYNQEAFPVNQVHDSVVVDCTARVAKQVSADVAHILGGVREYFTKHMGYEMCVDFPAEAEIGINLLEKE